MSVRDSETFPAVTMSHPKIWLAHPFINYFLKKHVIDLSSDEFLF